MPSEPTLSMLERAARAAFGEVTAAEPQAFHPAFEYDQDVWFAVARAVIKTLPELRDDVMEHQSYRQGNWSRRNIESFVDAILSEGGHEQRIGQFGEVDAVAHEVRDSTISQARHLWCEVAGLFCRVSDRATADVRVVLTRR